MPSCELLAGYPPSMAPIHRALSPWRGEAVTPTHPGIMITFGSEYLACYCGSHKCINCMGHMQWMTPSAVAQPLLITGTLHMSRPPAQAGDAENRSSELWSLQGQILADLRAQLQQEREARSLERAEWLAQMTALHEESRSLRAELLSLLGRHVAGAHDAHVTAADAARSTKGGGAVLPASSPAAVPDDDRSETEVPQPAPTSPPMSSDQETERAPWKDDLRLALAASEDTDILSIPAENFGDYLASRRRAGKDEAAQSGGEMSPEHAVSLPTMAAQPVAQLDLGPSDPARPAAPPPGPPPLLREGDDDISWMNALHSAMAEAGYHAGEDDEEEWYFGSGTTSALLTLQVRGRGPSAGPRAWPGVSGPDICL